MVLRIQRILAGIELFALVLWVGGLFAFGTLVHLPHALPDWPTPRDPIVSAFENLLGRFNDLEIIFAVAVLASNFVKVSILSRVWPLERVALLVSVIMLVFTMTYAYALRPKMNDRLSEIPTLAADQREAASTDYRKMHWQYTVLMRTNVVLGLFMVYAYRTFEEKKLQALASIIRR